MPEIQALRAIAVGLVVAFHVWPHKGLVSGFVGVDAFFVISGYLITAHLLREVERTGTVRLLSFYARRMRRLLPASFTVLLFALIGTALLAPGRTALATAREITASTMYVENLWLAKKSITYSASNDVASAVQHYWSLSAEEQFYLVWPGLILLGLFLARRFFKGHTVKTIAGLLLLLTATSLVHSIVLSHTAQSTAYFVTTTRVWEFGIGALTAFFLREYAPPPQPALLLRWIGVVVLFASGFTLSKVAFPGMWALAPTLATSAIIVAGDTGPADPLTRLVELRPTQWLGDISYAIYLWHWPLLVLGPFALGHELTGWNKVLLLILTLILSDATRRFIEIPGQRAAWLGKSNARTFLAVGIAMALMTVSAQTIIAAKTKSQASEAASFAQRAGSDPCLGAAAVRNQATCGLKAFNEPPITNVNESFAPWGGTCEYGKPCWTGERPNKVVMLIGDSHTESWFFAIKPLADKAGWGTIMTVKGGCPASNSPIVAFMGKPRDGQQCLDFTSQVKAQIAEVHPDLVISTYFTGETYSTEQQGIDGFTSFFKEITALAPVVVLRDYPATGETFMPDCLATHATDPTACTTPRDQALLPDLAVTAAKAMNDPRISVIDLTDTFCDASTCYSAIGTLPVYYDHDHINRIFSASLQEPLAQHLTFN
ncbi:MAG: acyltransferase family protein [Propionibacteriaceae bacterium]